MKYSYRSMYTKDVWGKVAGRGKEKTEREPLIFASKYTAEHGDTKTCKLMFACKNWVLQFASDTLPILGRDTAGFGFVIYMTSHLELTAYSICDLCGLLYSTVTCKNSILKSTTVDVQ